MTKIEINKTEYQALVELMKDAKVSIPLGYILGNLMGKVEQAMQQEGEKKLKEKFTEKKK